MKFFDQLRPTLWTAVFFVCLSMTDCTGLSCYQCTVAPKPGARFSTSQLCRQFEPTSHFQTYCPNSTLCMKRSIHHRLGNGTLVVTSVERGCAPQVEVTKVYDAYRKSWDPKFEIIPSAYDERCFIGVDGGSPGGPPEYCFCSYHLCNAATKTKNFYALYILLGGLLLWIRRSSC